jgi:hypothetical protein
MSLEGSQTFFDPTVGAVFVSRGQGLWKEDMGEERSLCLIHTCKKKFAKIRILCNTKRELLKYENLIRNSNFPSFPEI